MITNINVGLTANDGLGDKLRDAFIIVNENFDAIDAILTGTGTLTISQIAGLQTALTNIDNQLAYIPGLQTDINDINNTIYTINQTLNSQNNSIADLYDEITNLQNQIFARIEEAPIDGITYGRRDGGWVAVGAGSIDLDGVLANGNTSIDKTIEVTNAGSSIKTSITPSKTTIGDISSERIEFYGDKITFKSSTTEAILKYNIGQASGFIPTFQLPSKPITGLYTLATTVDYTLQAVTTNSNTTNLGIQFQPVTNTGTASKYITITNALATFISQSEGSFNITNDKIVWSRFGNQVSLSGWNASGSNTADYILPTKPFLFGGYTLATTADITVVTVVSGNTNNLNIVSSGTTRTLYSRGLTSSNQSITISPTGSSASSTYAWNVALNPDINYNYLQANTASTATGAVGRFVWNDTDGTLDLGLKGGNVTLQVGQEQLVRVVNKTATNITLQESAYQAVRVTGAQGQRLKVDLALATNDLLSAETIGLVTETILNNQEGFVTISGLVNKIDTTGSLQSETWNDGDILYLSPTVAGQITNIKPSAPDHMVIIGYVVYSHAVNGKIFVKVNNGYELDELHNVKISGTPSNGEVLTYNNGLWEDKTEEFRLRQNVRVISSDFIGTVAAANTPFVFSALSAGTNTTTTYLNGTNPGVTRISSSSAATSGGLLSSNTLTAGTIIPTIGQQMDFVFRTPNTIIGVGSTIRAGFFVASSTITDATSGFYMEIIDNQLYGKTAKSSSRSQTATSYSISNGGLWFHMRITYKATDLIEYNLYNMSGTLLWSDTLTTNIPILALTCNLLAFSSPTTTIATEMINMDYLAFTLPTSTRGALN